MTEKEIARRKIVDEINFRKAINGDFAAFCEYCFTDDKTGKHWALEDFHRDWINIVSKNERSVIFAPVDHAKTSLLGMAYPLWLLGKNPNLRILTVSDTATQANKILSQGARQVLENERLRNVFPDLKPKLDSRSSTRFEKWSENAIVVHRDSGAKDPSWQAVGSLGPILGARVDVAILDDVVDFENSKSPTLKKNIIQWVDSTLWGRLTDGAKVIVIGTAWVADDLYHVLSAREHWLGVKYSCEPKDVEDGYRLARWSNRPKFYIQKKADLPPHEYDRQLRCRVRKSEERTFPSVHDCFKIIPTNDVGKLRSIVRGMIPDAVHIQGGVDLSSPRRPGNAIIVTAKPKGSAREKLILDVRFGAWTSPQTAKRIDALDRYWGVDDWVVENNAYQGALIEWMRHDNYNATIIPFTTGSQKADPDIGLPGLESEFATGDWIIPVPQHCASVIKDSSANACRCDYCRLIVELMEHPDYSTSDGVMAVWFSRGNKASNSGARVRQIDPETGTERIHPIRLGDFYPENRITQGRGVDLPEASGDIIQLFRDLNPEQGKNVINELMNRKVNTPYPKQDVIKVLQEAIIYCEAIA